MTTTSRRRRLLVLAAAQLAFAASVSPDGVRSGQWSVPWLPDPDFLVFVASGAIWVHPILLYPLWAGLACGDLFRRFATTLLLCLAIAAAVSIRSLCRGSREPQVIPIMFLAASFSLLALGFWSIHRLWRWRIGIPGDPPSCNRNRARRAQFRLLHIFECIALAACLLTAYRYYFPDGAPDEVIAGWRRQIATLWWAGPRAILVCSPTALVPWTVLGFRRPSASCILSVTGAVLSWVGLDCALNRFGGQPIAWPEIIAIQSGATAAGLISALVLRAYGYRIFRVERGPEAAT